MTNEAATADNRLVRSARELHDPRYLHWPGCGHRRTLADVLKRTCPNCGAVTFQGLAPEVTPERAREMLVELESTRRQLKAEAPARDRRRAREYRSQRA